jgi:GT2 family glycosyltransferase
MYKVSVITGIGPLSKYGKFIERYTENVQEQEMFEETEHVIVYSEYGKELDILSNLKNFKLVKEQEMLGVYNAWNIGIQHSSTKYVTNWNIDDLRHPSNIKKKHDLLEANPNISVAYNYYIATSDFNENFYNIKESGKYVLLFPDNYEEYAQTACLCGPDPVWRKEIHSEIGYFDYVNYPSIGDWEMWLRMAQNGYKFKLIPEILCIYYDHADTVSRNSESLLNLQFKNLREQYKDFKTQHHTLLSHTF